MTAAFRTLAVLALAAASLPVAAQMMGREAPKMFIAGSGPDDLWDITTKMEMSGMSMPAQSSQICVKKGRNVGEEAVPKQDNCKVTEMRTTGNKTTFAMECTGEEPMTMRGETSSTPTSFDSRVSLKGTRKGSEMQMNMTSSGRRVSACTDQSEQVMASAKAQGQAEIARMCADAGDRYQYQVFAKGQTCEANRKPFCDKVSGLATSMRQPAEFRNVAAKTSVESLRGSFSVCDGAGARLDFDATAKAACTSAVGARDWSFLGIGVCDAEVMAQAPSKCVGRDYYKVDRSLIPMCNRYAMLTRGNAPAQAQSANPAPPTQAEAPKPDPIKQGVDAVRKLLPF
jgi:hypothetical protein